MAMAEAIIKQETVQNPFNLVLPQSDLEEQYCRLCLSSCDNQFKHLFSPFNTTHNVAEVIEDFSKVAISQDDEFSKLICIICFIKLAESENFKELIVNTDLKLKNRQMNSIDPLQVDQIDNNQGMDEDSDHEKINVEEIDLKKELQDEDDSIVSTLKLIKTETVEKDVELVPSEISEIANKEREDGKCDVEASKNDNGISNNSQIENLSEPVKVKRTVGRLKCPHCDRFFISPLRRAAHIRIHTWRFQFRCSYCRKEFINRSALMVHEQCHFGEKNYKCDICNESFNLSSELLTHERTHKDSKPFKCDQCSKEYKHKFFLTMHKASTHATESDEPAFSCTICNKTFPTKHHFNIHETRAHKEEKLRDAITCDVCGESVMDYVQHMEVHSKPYKCIICSQAFSADQKLKEHLAEHTGKKLYECDICKKMFRCNGGLFNHKKTHDKSKWIQCEGCDEKFKLKRHWKRHFEKMHQKS